MERSTLSSYNETNTARAFGVPVSTLGLYRSLGLLNPLSCDGVLYYSERDRLRIQIVQKALRLGFSLKSVEEILARPARKKVFSEIACERYLSDLRESDEMVALALHASRKIINARKSNAGFVDNTAYIRAEMECHRGVLARLAAVDGMMTI